MRLLLISLLPGCFWFRGGGSHCPDDRTVTLGVQADVAAFAGCKRASGVMVRTGATIDLSPLRELREITGDLVIGPSVGIDHASFNALVHVGGQITVTSNSSTTGVFFPRLEQAGRISIEGNASLTTIALPRLTQVRAIVIDDNHDLEVISASVLERLPELVITANPNLTIVELGRLGEVDSVRVEENRKLDADIARALRAKQRDI